MRAETQLESSSIALSNAFRPFDASDICESMPTSSTWSNAAEPIQNW